MKPFFHKTTILDITLILLVSYFFISCTKVNAPQKAIKEYVEISKHGGIGERYINNRDSLILDLTFPVQLGEVPDSLKPIIYFYKLLENNSKYQENQFYWHFSDRWFLNASIYEKGNIPKLIKKTTEQYEKQYSDIEYKKSSYEEITGNNNYIVGNLENKKYSFWEFFYETKNNKIFRVSLVGLYPGISERQAEMNGRAQIKNLLKSEKTKFLFSPEQTLLGHYMKSNFDPIKTLGYFETVKDGLSESDYGQIHQILAFLYSCVNDYSKHNKHVSAHFSSDSTWAAYRYFDDLISNPETITYVPAKEEILSSLKGKNFLMINENHNYPRCRIFLKNMLEELYEMGFTTFVAEGVGNNSKEDYRQLNKIRKEQGFYTNESEFASLLREAKNIGFNIYSYSPIVQNLQKFSDKTKREEYRDSIMSENIKAIYAGEMQSQGKMIIFCGHDHLVKSKNPDRKLLGQYINEWKGKEALFVDQS